MRLSKPDTTYWSGAWRYGPYLLGPVVVLNIASWVLAIAMLAFGSTHGEYSSNTYINPRNGGEYALRMFALWAELIHLPIHILLFLEVFPRWRLHPAAALSFALVMMGVWFNFAFWGFMVDWLTIEWYVPKEWLGLACARFAVSLITTAIYIVYVVYAAGAVHQWRRKTGQGRHAKKSLSVSTSSGEPAVYDLNVEAGKR